MENTSFNELEDLRELKSSSALRKNVNLVLAYQPYDTCSVRDQVCFAHDAFFKETIKDAVRFMRNMMASGAHDHNFVPVLCSSVETRASVGRRSC